MKILNLTPHAINVYRLVGLTRLTFVASGAVARIETVVVPLGAVEIECPRCEGTGEETHGEPGCSCANGSDVVALVRAEVGEVTGLPAPQEGVLYLVSGMVRAALPGRTDLVSPGALLRDSSGRPVGCRGLNSNR